MESDAGRHLVCVWKQLPPQVSSVAFLIISPLLISTRSFLLVLSLALCLFLLILFIFFLFYLRFFLASASPLCAGLLSFLKKRFYEP